MWWTNFFRFDMLLAASKRRKRGSMATKINGGSGGSTHSGERELDESRLNNIGEATGKGIATAGIWIAVVLAIAFGKGQDVQFLVGFFGFLFALVATFLIW